MAHDLPRHTDRTAAAGRREMPVQLSRLLDAHKIVIGECASWQSGQKI